MIYQLARNDTAWQAGEFIEVWDEQAAKGCIRWTRSKRSQDEGTQALENTGKNCREQFQLSPSLELEEKDLQSLKCFEMLMNKDLQEEYFSIKFRDAYY